MLQRRTSCARHDFQIHMARSGAEQPALRVLHHVTAPYRGRGQFVGIVVAVGRGTVDVHFRDGDFAAGVDAAAVSLYTGRRPRASAGLPLAVRMRVALLNAPETELVVVAYDDAYAVVSGPDGNRAYQRDMLRAFDDEALNADAPATPMDDDDDDDEGAPAPQLALGETVLVGRVGHVATVEQVPRAGDEEVLLRWESTGHCEEVALRGGFLRGSSSRRPVRGRRPRRRGPRHGPRDRPRRKGRASRPRRRPLKLQIVRTTTLRPFLRLGRTSR